MPEHPKIQTFLWYDGQAEEAATLYTSLFPDSRIVSVARGGPLASGSAMLVVFELAGQRFMALNGGPHFRFNEAVSLFVDCEDQAEIDRLWDALIADGGEACQCGWLKDRFGLSWQIVPTRLGELLQDPDPEKAARAHRAMLRMVKLDIAALEAAHRGE